MLSSKETDPHVVAGVGSGATSFDSIKDAVNIHTC